MSKRAKLPGADELFRRTAVQAKEADSEQLVDKATNIQDDNTPSPEDAKATYPMVSKATEAQSAESTDRFRRGPTARAETPKPRHDEKITFYCTEDELLRIEESRLKLRRESGIATDRGGLIRAAVRHALDELDRVGAKAGVVRHLDRRPSESS